jgi:hypothetical protein
MDFMLSRRLDDVSAFHDEADILQQRDIAQGITRHRDQISITTHGDRADIIGTA